jgi:hypothetical protein
MVTSMMVSLSALATALPVESTNTIGLGDGDNPITPVLCALATSFAMRAIAILAAITDGVMSRSLLADNDTARHRPW